MKCSIKDVAKKAKVSHTTVSRILRNVEGFSYSSSTREKVLSAAKELGYIPNFAAKLIRLKKTNLVGIAVQSHNSYATFRNIELASHFISHYKYDPLLVDLEKNSFFPFVQFEYLSGILCLYANQEKNAVNYCKQLKLKIPIVTVKSPCTKSPDVHAVVSDSSIGFSMAIKHLYELGHRNIAYVGYKESSPGDTRSAIFPEICKKYSVNPQLYSVKAKEENNSFLAGYNIAEEIIRKKELTAAICEDDEFAMGLIAGLRDFGCIVPRDFSVIGFDDLPFAGFTNPKLTTITVDSRKKIDTAVKLLISLIESTELQLQFFPSKITLRPVIIYRESTAKIKKT